MAKSDWTLAKWKSPPPPDKHPVNGNGWHHIELLARQEDFECVLLGSFGLGLKAIAAYTGFSVAQVSLRLKRAGISVMDWRKGHGLMSQMVFEALDRRAARQLEQRLRLLE